MQFRNSVVTVQGTVSITGTVAIAGNVSVLPTDVPAVLVFNNQTATPLTLANVSGYNSLQINAEALVSGAAGTANWAVNWFEDAGGTLPVGRDYFEANNNGLTTPGIALVGLRCKGAYCSITVGGASTPSTTVVASYRVLEQDTYQYSTVPILGTSLPDGSAYIFTGIALAASGGVSSNMISSRAGTGFLTIGQSSTGNLRVHIDTANFGERIADIIMGAGVLQGNVGPFIIPKKPIIVTITNSATTIQSPSVWLNMQGNLG